jgi:uncharacterized protein (DUF488 family)
MVGLEKDIMENSSVIWTIGHSTRTVGEFHNLLEVYGIELLADIRSLPGSRKFPHFDKEVLEKSLPEAEISYVHLKHLGGRRKVNHHSKNTGWRLPAFRGYADYMETEAFVNAAKELENLAKEKRTAIMCSEAVWWRCHRGLVSDWLKLQGWRVVHILTLKKSEEHPYTSVARVVDGELRYSGY